MKCKCGRSFVATRRGKGALMCRFCVSNRRRFLLKKKCVEYLGGRCIKCGYDKCVGSLVFHHRNPKTKEFTISGNHCKSWESIQRELDKCDLLCTNCHHELHYLEREYSRFEEEFLDVPIKNMVYCNNCGREFESYITSNKRFCSTTCAGQASKKIEWPEISELISKIRKSSFSRVSQELNVSDNAIRKHLRKHGVDPKNIRSIKDNRFVVET